MVCTEQVLRKHWSDTGGCRPSQEAAYSPELLSSDTAPGPTGHSPEGQEEGLAEASLKPHSLILLSQETMPQTSVLFSSILRPSCSAEVQPGMGERGGGADGSGDLIFQDGRLISGSLEALMEHLVPTLDYYPDVSAWAWTGV